MSAPRASTSAEAIALEDRYCARTYAPLPFVVARAKGCMTWSPEGVPRLDFLAAFSAVNQGHCHPRLLAALTEQASRLTLVSRAFHGDVLGAFARDLTAAARWERGRPPSLFDGALHFSTMRPGDWSESLSCLRYHA